MRIDLTEYAVRLALIRMDMHEMRRLCTARHLRWGPMDASRVIRDAHGRFLGSIGEDGVFKPAEGVTHEHVREALALHEAGSKTHQTLSAYLSKKEPESSQGASARVHIKGDPANLVRIFGRVLTNDELAGLVGAQPGDFVDVSLGSIGSPIGMHFEHPDGQYEGYRTISGDMARGIYISNDQFVVENQGRGIGSRIFADQVRMAAQLGVRTISTGAGRSDGYERLIDREVQLIGYYTWPRLGYDGPLEESFAERAQGALGLDDPPFSVQDLLLADGGLDYWFRYGYPIELSFDLTPSSRSRRILATYLEARGFDNTGVERVQQPAEQAKPIRPQWVDLDWSDEDEAAADAAWAKVVQAASNEGE